MKTSRSMTGAAAMACAALIALAGCSDTDDRRAVDGTIVQPGRPGDEPQMLDEAPKISPAGANDVDVMFAEMMIPHHAQALQMAELAPDAGGGAEVRRMADRIDGAQRPEIVLMAGWLTDQGVEAATAEEIETGRSESGEMSMSSMSGMASPDQMASLERARGEAFDRLFLQLMIRHHQGALDMVDDVLRDGSDQQINELATGIAADQSAEIGRMRELLGD